MRKIVRTLLLATLFTTFAAPLIHAQEADVLVTKTGPAQSAADTDVAYNVTVTNLGPDPAPLVTLSDAIPSGMTFVSSTQNTGPGFSCATPTAGDTTGSIECSSQVLASGESADFTFVFHIPAGTAPNTFFTNTANVTSAIDPNDENNSASAVTNTPPLPSGDMTVEKTGPAGAAADTDVSFTITITNAGPDEAASISLEDTLPGTMTFVSLTQDSGPTLSCVTPAVGSGGTITCTAATFAAGATASFTLTGHIPAGTPAGTTFQNTATITSENDPNEENNLSSTLLVVSAADLSVVKSGPASVDAGDNITYTITVTNNGPDDASSVTLDDALPAGTTFVSLNQNNGPTGICATPAVGTNGSITCDFTGFPASASAQFTLVVETGNATSASNTAIVTTTSSDSNNNNNSSTVVTTIVPSADLSVAKGGPATAAAGTDITYTITVANDGPSTATNVSLTDAVPANTTFVSSTQNSGPVFSCAKPAVGGTGTLTCTIASFAPGATATFTMVVHVASSTLNGSGVSNTAQITSSTNDPDPSDNNSGIETGITASANVGGTKNGPASVVAGSDITYTLSITNAGPSDATDVHLTDNVPANTTFVSSAQNSGPTFSCTTPSVGGTGLIDCSIATLTPGQTATFTIVVNVPAATANGTSIVNTANFTTTTSDPDSSDNTDSVTTNVAGSPDIAGTKNGPATVDAGSDITYTLSITNAGFSDATDVHITDATPANTTFVSMTQNTGPTFSCTTPTVGGTGTIDCSIATLAAKATATFTLVLHIPANTPAGTSIVNTANFDTASTDPATQNDTATATAAVTESADVGGTKSGPTAVDAGETITYSLSINNAGPSDAANVHLTDTMPANTTFASLTQNSGPEFMCGTPSVGGTGPIDCGINTLTPGQSATFTLVLNVTGGTPDGTSLVNTANFTTVTPDPNGTNNTATATALVTATADISIVKTGPESVTPGTDAAYVLTVTNAGPATALSVTLTDILPANTVFMSETQNSGPTFNCVTPAVGTNGTVTCTIATLAAGASAEFTIVVRVSPQASDTVANTATVASPSDPTPGNNSSTTTASVVAPGIPTLSPWGLALLALALIAIVMKR